MNSGNAQTKRYDRQIRIWGAHGQSALETAKVCLLNAGPTGSETLKNLVLGGIASASLIARGLHLL
jgi:NEDD8-activating enzyme E1 regulatory subunit